MCGPGRGEWGDRGRSHLHERSSGSNPGAGKWTQNDKLLYLHDTHQCFLCIVGPQRSLEEETATECTPNQGGYFHTHGLISTSPPAFQVRVLSPYSEEAEGQRD